MIEVQSGYLGKDDLVRKDDVCHRHLQLSSATCAAQPVILSVDPDLEGEDIYDAVLYAAEAVRERMLPLSVLRNSSATTSSHVPAQRPRLRGHDASRIHRYGMQTAADDIVFNHAGTEGRILVSADTDFT